jgi:hypothetical protein
VQKSTRSWTLALSENVEAIEQWRSTLPERERQRLRNAQSIVRKWQRATRADGHKHGDVAQHAAATWRRFTVLVERLPPVDAASV